jgi:hypothetical protein
MAKLVYLLCALTSVGCAALLVRACAQKRTRILFWSSIGFLFFGIANLLLFLDLVIYPEIDLMFFRNGAALVGVVALLYGLIGEVA